MNSKHDGMVRIMFCCGLVVVNFIHIHQGYLVSIGPTAWFAWKRYREIIANEFVNNHNINTTRESTAILWVYMMIPSNGIIFRVTGPFWGEFIGHKGQWRGALMFSLIWDWTNGWANNRGAGDLRRHGVHYDVILMYLMRYNVGGG